MSSPNKTGGMLDHIAVLIKFISLIALIVALASPWIYASGSENYPDIVVKSTGSVKTDIPLETASYKISMYVLGVKLIGVLEIIMLFVLLLSLGFWVYYKYIIGSKKLEDYARIYTFDIILGLLAIIFPLIGIAYYDRFSLTYKYYERRGEMLKLITVDSIPLYKFTELSLGIGPYAGLIAGLLLFVAAIIEGISMNKQLL